MAMNVTWLDWMTEPSVLRMSDNTVNGTVDFPNNIVSPARRFFYRAVKFGDILPLKKRK